MERLFDPPEKRPDHRLPADGPLAARMRPTTLEEFVGQEHLLAPGSALRAALESGHPHSMVLYGPPGTGKTTLARLAAAHADAAFEELSAVQAGRPEVREVIARARERRSGGRSTIFFLDEIHRFNKAQQDALLPAVEDGLVTLIGATTENPYFEVNNALLSRTQIYELEQLTTDDIETLLRRAIERGECPKVTVGDDVIEFLAARANGDARAALNALELACSTATGERVTLADAEDAMQRKAVLYDKGGDQHYDYISAWIKSTRGSDPDASLYYLAAMLEGGEDRALHRPPHDRPGLGGCRQRRAAGAADRGRSRAGGRARRPARGVVRARPGGDLPVLAPKSDAVKRAIGEVRSHIGEHGAARPPAALQSAAYPGAATLGRGAGYDYPHDQPGHVNQQEHLPEGLGDLRFYLPDDAEADMRERLERIRRARGR